MAISKALIMIVFALFCFLFSIIDSTIVSGLPSEPKTNWLCNQTEKDALLKFKDGLWDFENVLSSWVPEGDCCEWKGVSCHNITGHVVRLDLYFFLLAGEVSPALLQLEFLNYLDLGWNYFIGVPIPGFLGSMRSLTFLNLRDSSFGGLIPPTLGNLSNLQYLSLGGGGFLSPPLLYVENLDWISHLSSLQDLYMHKVDLHKGVHWVESMAMLPSLFMLWLDDCKLDNMSPSLEYVNFTSLAFLFVSGNHFNHPIPNWLFNLTTTSLLELTLSENQLIGQIPECLGKFKYLRVLSLAGNSLNGPIPSSLGNLSSLEDLYVKGNSLNGTLPSSLLWLLPKLEYLHVGYNSLLVGTISEAHFKKLSNLKSLEMSSTSLIFKVKSDWIPPFQLRELSMSSCKMGPHFPAWLQTQTSLSYLDISNSGIRSIAPTWFWKWASRIHELINLSNNQISGNLSGVFLDSAYIQLKSNCFTGELPALSPNVFVLNMANNSCSGPISHFFCQNLNRSSQLGALDLSNNDLSGHLPHCWKTWPSLTHLNLGNNNISGKIPNSISSLFALKVLHLQNNSFSGSVPTSIRNCISLGLLDLSGNQLLGNISNWVGELTALNVVSLRSNKFTGEIPSQICQLSSLIVLDLADNGLSGIIPRCLNNFSLVAKTETPDELFIVLQYSFYERQMEGLVLMTVGREFEYKEILPYVRMMDLSSNKFSGSIPSQLSQLLGLRFLNLSRNHLNGSIPEKIGRMSALLSLDLSINHLSGEIPQSLSNLTFLNRLNLSYNQLKGRIPLSTQLQSFDAFSYIGNAQLCGAPLSKNCTDDDDDDESQSVAASAIEGNEEGDDEMQGLYISIGVGFIVGFWVACGGLIFKKKWRYAYFQFVSDVSDWMYVGVAIRLNCFRRQLRDFSS